jgi:hypothetical protein
MTVDRRYYHVNEPFGEQYFEINLQPGYQRVCGKGALEFVSNRHEDTSVMRDARDQRLLLELKSQYGPSLFESRQRFEHILGRAVETDLHSTGEVLDLLSLLIEAQGKPVRQVPFQATLLQTYDTASPKQIHESVENFLGGTAAIAKNKVNASLRTAPRRHAPRRSITAEPQSDDLLGARGGALRCSQPPVPPRVSARARHVRGRGPGHAAGVRHPRPARPHRPRLRDRDPDGHARPVLRRAGDLVE